MEVPKTTPTFEGITSEMVEEQFSDCLEIMKSENKRSRTQDITLNMRVLNSFLIMIVLEGLGRVRITLYMLKHCAIIF